MFRFKQFNIEHDRSSMKVGTDGVLLGAWADVRGASRALDVGTGCGLIAVMLAQRAPCLQVDAIDIDSDSVSEAKLNFANSPWSDRLCAMEGDFNDIILQPGYDLIVSNPPFFTNGILPPAQARMNARHTMSLTYDQLIAHACRLLADDGKISIVTPVDVREALLEECSRNNLYLSRLTDVVSIEGLPPKRLLWEITKKPCETDMAELLIEKIPGEYTEDYRSLCRDFYLKF